MNDLNNNPLWPALRKNRKYQKFFGLISAVLFTLALIALVDGLQSKMRSGPDELRLVAGTTESVAGPSALKNPVPSDLVARFTPTDAPLEFRLDNFFPGYWFGGGMWRGQIVVPATLAPGRYGLSVSFKGAAGQSPMNYVLYVYASRAELRAASLSLFYRYLNLNPFILASSLGGAGIFFGLITWFFGRRYILGLLSLEILQAFPGPDSELLWCHCPKKYAPAIGAKLAIYSADGKFLSAARAIELRKGKLVARSANPLPAAGVYLAALRTPPSVADAAREAANGEANPTQGG